LAAASLNNCLKIVKGYEDFVNAHFSSFKANISLQFHGVLWVNVKLFKDKKERKKDLIQ